MIHTNKCWSGIYTVVCMCLIKFVYNRIIHWKTRGLQSNLIINPAKWGVGLGWGVGVVRCGWTCLCVSETCGSIRCAGWKGLAECDTGWCLYNYSSKCWYNIYCVICAHITRDMLYQHFDEYLYKRHPIVWALCVWICVSCSLDVFVVFDGYAYTCMHLHCSLGVLAPTITEVNQM